MLRVGIVGAGNIGRIHASAYKQHQLADLVGICDVVKEKADSFAAQFDIRPHYSLGEMLAAEKLDILSVVTSGFENGSHHFEPAMQALEAGVAVLCEKPLSNDIAQARQLVARAHELGVCFGTDLNHRFVPIARQAREFIDRGDLGEPLFVNMALWIRNPREVSPWLHLRALHPHSIDVMRYFCGDVKRVHAFLNQGPLPDGGRRTTWSNASINMQFKSGCVGHLTGSYDMSMYHPIERCEVGGSKARFVIDNVYERLTIYPHDRPDATVVGNSVFSGIGAFNDTIKHRIARFLEQIDQKVPAEQIEASGADGLAAQEVIEAAIRSWEQGTIVDL